MLWRATGSRPRLRGAWPIVAVLVAVVVIPTACVLWFMNAAMANERLAVRQRLTDVYRRRTSQAQASLAEYWGAKASTIEQGRDLPAGELFAKLTGEGVADSVIIYDGQGNVAYPPAALPTEADGQELSQQFSAAKRLERDHDLVAKAGQAYAAIAALATDPDVRARAIQARARCLLRTGRKEEAISIIDELLAEPAYRNAADPNGRAIIPSCLLLAIQLSDDGQGDRAARLAEQLRRQLNDYTQPMPSAQRLFLMQQLRSLSGDQADLPTLAAEELAAEYLELDELADTRPSRLAPTGLPGLVQFISADRTVVALYRRDRLAEEMRLAAGLDEPCPGASIELVGPTSPRRADSRDPLLSHLAGSALPGWQVMVYLEGDDPFAAAAEKQNVAHLWTGVLSILAIALLATAAAGYFGRQMKLTRLKNELISTVSHELKTPLASMRMLVDTLLEGRSTSHRQSRDYLRMIVKENARLSRLIDNFLAFSRMEQNKSAFHPRELNVGQLVQTVAESVGERFQPPHCRLDVDLATDLPSIYADRDAMETVLFNLLDNAWKYSDKDKHITIRAYPGNGSVCLAVSDNGIGMSRRAAAKIFDRFYQADQMLSRRAGGCGLGLSIVKFMLDAHRGSIAVASSPGAGSTFTVTLPAAAPADAAGGEGDT